MNSAVITRPSAKTHTGTLDFLRVAPRLLDIDPEPPFIIRTTAPSVNIHAPQRNPTWPWLAALAIVAAFVSVATLAAP